MTAPNELQLGVMFKREHAPEDTIAVAQQAEAAGFDQLWVVEDCFYASAIATAATALAVTDAIHVGIGIMPVVMRNAALAAMELATLARLHPGRLLPGFGHGVTGWMKQIGAFPPSQLAALDEVTTTVCALLRGEEVTMQGRTVQLDHVQLEYPPETVPPVALGVRSIKSLQIAGRVADGTILPEGSAPGYVRWAREQIAAGQDSAGRTDAHHVTVFVLAHLDDDAEPARAALRPLVADIITRERVHPQIVPTGLQPEIHALLADVGPERFPDAMPEDWIDQFTASGSPDQCAAAVRRLAEAGADSVVLVPFKTGADEVARLGAQILPALGR